jgi:hypothetical protein
MILVIVGTLLLMAQLRRPYRELMWGSDVGSPYEASRWGAAYWDGVARIFLPLEDASPVERDAQRQVRIVIAAFVVWLPLIVVALNVRAGVLADYSGLGLVAIQVAVAVVYASLTDIVRLLRTAVALPRRILPFAAAVLAVLLAAGARWPG